MARETKVGLLVGMGVILLIGIILSDHLAVVQNQRPAQLTGFGPGAEQGIASVPPSANAGLTYPPDTGGTQQIPPAAMHTAQGPIPMPNEDQPTAASAGQQPGQPAQQQQQATPGGLPSNVKVAEANGNANVPVAPPVVEEARVETAQAQPMAIHVVKHGDTLYALARQYYKDAEKWSLIQEANAKTIGDKGQLKDGAKLIIPKKPDAVVPEEFKKSDLLEVAEPSTSHGASDAAARLHSVESGETLATIAKEQLGDANRWKEIFDLNKDQLKRPQDLQVGMKLRLPAAKSATANVETTVEPAQATGSTSKTSTRIEPLTSAATAAKTKTYTVKAGDTLRTIAARQLGNGNKWDQLFKANQKQLGSEAGLKVGQVLIIPATSDR